MYGYRSGGPWTVVLSFLLVECCVFVNVIYTTTTFALLFVITLALVGRLLLSIIALGLCLSSALLLSIIALV